MKELFLYSRNRRADGFRTGVVLLLLGVTSCGFQLRGTQPDFLTNISSIHVIDSDASTVGREVRTQLTLSGIPFSPTSEEAEYTLHLDSQDVNQSVLSVSALTGKVEEYQLLLSVRMSLTDREKNERLTNQLIRVSRDYAFDDRAVLGSESERQLLVDEMTKQAASQVIRRLDTLTRQQ
jgi:LPS-assembly lipoprotein